MSRKHWEPIVRSTGNHSKETLGTHSKKPGEPTHKLTEDRMDKYTEILRRYWGYPDFRGVQRDIIESVCAGRDTLGLMPTGGGKSITFQVPAMAMDGVCLVISPLISLMKDQVDNLRRRGIPAAAVYTGMRRDQVIATLENCIFGGIRLLYVSPERLSSQLFLAKLRHMRVSLITVDEAHCVSQWGHDFRPSYLRIADLRDLLPGVPLLALTATATEDVIKDIEKQLRFDGDTVFRQSFERENLSYVVRPTDDKEAELLHILSSVAGSAIVYVNKREDAKEYADLLNSHGIAATWYHARLSPSVKDTRQDDWQHGRVRVMVATSAFGMGIDKPDVRLVIHPDTPSSIEEYFQEAGRAGRDGLRSYAVLLADGNEAWALRGRIRSAFPTREYIADVYDHLAYYFQVGVNSGGGRTFTLPLHHFCTTYHYFEEQADTALTFLHRAGYIEYVPVPDRAARVMMLVERDDLYRLDRLPREEDLVISALLRLYSGLFSDYQFITFKAISECSGLGEDQAHRAILSLSHRHILKYIPPTTQPLVRYATDRVDGSDITIPREIYERRREEMERRARAMLAYITDRTDCRSRQLLRYFGEKSDHDCGHCDVCIARKKGMTTGG